MKTEDIIKKLRSTQVVDPAPEQKKVQQAVAVRAAQEKEKIDKLFLFIGLLVLAILFVTALWAMWANRRASDLSIELDPSRVRGLRYAEEFNPNQGVTVINIKEGQDRSVAGTSLGSTLPIMSRFNHKSFTDTMYETVGSAPWALTENFASNISDPGLMRYLLSNDSLAKGFKERPDVAPLLQDPQLLAAFTQDMDSMKEFFDSETVKKVFANEQMVRAVAGSRFMSHLLVSPSLLYFRRNPQEVVQLIEQNPYLNELRQNPGVQAAVRENPYLKTLADQLLGTSPTTDNAPVAAEEN